MPIGATTDGVGFNEILSTTLQKIQGTLVDQTLQNHPTLDFFREIITPGEGPSYITSVRGALLGRTTTTDALGSFSTDVDNEIAGVAKYDYGSPIVTPTAVAWLTIALNEGSNRIVDLVKAHIEAAIDDHAVALAGAIYGNGGVSGAFNSLDDIVSATGSVGGIDAATSPWWAAQEVTSSAASEDVRVAFRRLHNAVSDAAGQVGDIMIVGADLWDEYESELDPSVRYTAMGVGETRFNELRFNGLVLRRDGVDCDPSTGYLLNKNSLIAKHLAGNFMKAHPAQMRPGTLTEVVPHSSVLLFGTNQRRSNGKVVRTA